MRRTLTRTLCLLCLATACTPRRLHHETVAAAPVAARADGRPGPVPPRVLSFSSERKPARFLIVFLHGYGGQADNALERMQKWATALPEADILIPDGLDPHDGDGRGRQWFSVEGADGTLPTARIDAAGHAVSDWIDAELDRRSLTHDRVVIAGFSQGAILSEWLAVHRHPNPLAVIALSGLFAAEDPVAQSQTKTPVLLVHGSADQTIPIARETEAKAALLARGAPVEEFIEPGVRHLTTHAGSDRALAFIKEHARVP